MIAKLAILYFCNCYFSNDYYFYKDASSMDELALSTHIIAPTALVRNLFSTAESIDQ
jgi:hypothetical protein